MAIIVVVIVIVPVAIVISVAIAVPIVMVFKSATVALPVAFVELAAIVARANPAGPFVRRTSPVSLMPAIASARWVPVSIHPEKIRAWPGWPFTNDPGSRRRTDANSERNLSVPRRHESKQQNGKHSSSKKFFHGLSPSVERCFVAKVCRGAFDSAIRGIQQRRAIKGGRKKRGGERVSFQTGKAPGGILLRTLYGEQKANMIKCRPMDLRRCQVTVRDFEGIAHRVEVTASSLYEAVALGLHAIRKSAWAEEVPQGPDDIVVAVSDVAVEHRVPLRKFNEWLGRTAGSPKEVSQRKRVRELLD